MVNEAYLYQWPTFNLVCTLFKIALWWILFIINNTSALFIPYVSSFGLALERAVDGWFCSVGREWLERGVCQCRVWRIQAPIQSAAKKDRSWTLLGRIDEICTTSIADHISPIFLGKLGYIDYSSFLAVCYVVKLNCGDLYNVMHDLSIVFMLRVCNLGIFSI